jgi:hypothetical protein
VTELTDTQPAPRRPLRLVGASGLARLQSIAPRYAIIVVWAAMIAVYAGTWVGIYFLATGILGLQLLGLQAWVSPVFYGGVLVIAVTISTLLHRRAS